MLTPEETQIVQYGKQQGKSQQDVIKALAQYRATAPTTTPKPQSVAPTTQQPSFTDGLKETWGDIKETGTGISDVIKTRGEKQRQIMEAQASGQQGALSTGFQTATNLLGAVGGVVGEGIVGLGKAILPQEKETAIKTAVGGVAQKVMNMPETKQFIQNYKDLEKSNPEMARNIVATAEGGEFLLNFLGLGGAVKAGEATIKGGQTALKGALKTGEEALTTAKQTAMRTGEAIGETATKAREGIVGVVGKTKELVGMGKKDALTIAEEAITPSAREITPTEYKELLRQGKISPKTATTEAKYILSEAEKAKAKKYSYLLQSQDPVKNAGSVIDEIALKDAEVGKYLDTQTTQIWSKKRFKTALLDSLKPIDDITIPSSRLTKAKYDLVNSFVDSLPEKATLKDLWTARKEFDRFIKFSGSPNLKNDMSRAVRNAVQDFISQSTDNVTYKNLMNDMRELFDIVDIIETKGTKEKGMSALKAWMQANPQKAKAAKWMLGITGAGVAGSILF